jgi:hypothetical protein
MKNQTQDRLGDDILHGVPEIARFLRERENQTRNHVRKGHYDAAIFRVGRIIKGSKAAFRDLLRPQSRAGGAP